MINIYAVPSFIAAITTFILMVLVYYRGKRNSTNKAFVRWLFCILVWHICVFGMFTTQDEKWALVLSRFLHAGIILIPITFLHFVIELTEIDGEQKRHILKEGYLLSFVFFVLNIFTSLFIKDIHKLKYSFYGRPGPLYPLFLFFFVSLIVYSTLILFNKLKDTRGLKHVQIKYVLIASLIGYIGGAIDFLPIFGVDIYNIGNLINVFYASIVTYAVLRYNLMDVTVAFTRAGIFAFVYLFVLGIPFLLGYRYHLWKYSTALMLFLATLGPFIYNYLSRRAEDILLKEQKRYQQTLLRASQGMTLVKELDKLLKLIVHIITKTIRLKYVAIYIFDKNTDTFNLKARRGQPVDVQLAVNTVSPLLKFVLNHKRPITQEGLEGVYADKDKIDPQSLRQEMKSMGASVLVPSIVENQLLAFLVLGEKVSGQHYTEDDLNVFSILANQASLAIENAIFYEETGKTMAEKFREHRLWSLGKMGSGIGHQINNRFAVITFKLDALRMIEVEKLKNTNPTTDQKKLIKTMEDSLVSVRDEALRGGEIATTLTSFARDTSGFKGIPLEDVIKGATNLLSCKFNITELNLEVNLPPHAPPVLGNLSQLQDVFMNIMDNAHDALLKRESEIEAGNPKAGARFTPKVAITGHVKGNRWHIEIKDNGIGMKEDELKQLFIPFFTTKASSEKGTGLGLSIIKQIIDAHKGTVTAESAYGQGTTFFINLPLFA